MDVMIVTRKTKLCQGLRPKKILGQQNDKNFFDRIKTIYFFIFLNFPRALLFIRPKFFGNKFNNIHILHTKCWYIYFDDVTLLMK